MRRSKTAAFLATRTPFRKSRPYRRGVVSECAGSLKCSTDNSATTSLSPVIAFRSRTSRHCARLILPRAGPRRPFQNARGSCVDGTRLFRPDPALRHEATVGAHMGRLKQLLCALSLLARISSASDDLPVMGPCDLAL